MPGGHARRLRPGARQRRHLAATHHRNLAIDALRRRRPLALDAEMVAALAPAGPATVVEDATVTSELAAQPGLRFPPPSRAGQGRLARRLLRHTAHEVAASEDIPLGTGQEPDRSRPAGPASRAHPILMRYNLRGYVGATADRCHGTPPRSCQPRGSIEAVRTPGMNYSARQWHVQMAWKRCVGGFASHEPGRRALSIAAASTAVFRASWVRDETSSFWNTLRRW